MGDFVGGPNPKCIHEQSMWLSLQGEPSILRVGNVFLKVLEPVHSPLITVFDFASFLPCFHQCLARLHRVGLNLAGPIPARYCPLEVESYRADLLHLMCSQYARLQWVWLGGRGFSFTKYPRTWLSGEVQGPWGSQGHIFEFCRQLELFKFQACCRLGPRGGVSTLLPLSNIEIKSFGQIRCI